MIVLKNNEIDIKNNRKKKFIYKIYFLKIFKNLVNNLKFTYFDNYFLK